MSSTIHVEAARIPDRDALLRELRSHALDARAVDEIGIVVRSDDDERHVSDEVYAEVESVIMAIGAHFVPIKHDGVIYIRPPVG